MLVHGEQAGVPRSGGGSEVTDVRTVTHIVDIPIPGASSSSSCGRERQPVVKQNLGTTGGRVGQLPTLRLNASVLAHIVYRKADRIRSIHSERSKN